MSIEKLIRSIPKAEMHIHFGGAFRWSTVRSILKERGSETPPTPFWWAPDFVFSDFSLFSQIVQDYILPTTGSAELVARHMHDVLNDLISQNVRYVELIVNPLLHVGPGLTARELFEELNRARAHFANSIDCRLILGLRRTRPPREVFADLRHWLDESPDGVIAGVDLQSDERRGPAKDFRDLFEFCRDQGLRLRAHAGELCGAESVRESMAVLGVKHISHGVRAVEDQNLVEQVAKSGTFLHVCATSNERLGVYGSLKLHPLPVLFKAGCRVTLNSDDPFLFGTTITGEYLNAHAKMGLEGTDLIKLAETAFAGSLMVPAARRQCLSELAEVGARFGASSSPLSS